MFRIWIIALLICASPVLSQSNEQGLVYGLGGTMSGPYRLQMSWDGRYIVDTMEWVSSERKPVHYAGRLNHRKLKQLIALRDAAMKNGLETQQCIDERRLRDADPRVPPPQPQSIDFLPTLTVAIDGRYLMAPNLDYCWSSAANALVKAAQIMAAPSR